MFAAERISKIRDFLFEYKHVNVSTLSSILSVSEVTVRRDLEKLEKEGFLTKTHGGAIINEELVPEVKLNRIEGPLFEEKRQIGIAAAQMINNNDLIFLGEGNTCLQIAKNIKERKNLTIVTNSVNILLELANQSNINLILAGGILQSIDSNFSLVGQFAESMLSRLFVNKAFFSVNGITLSHGYTVNNTEQAQIYHVLMKNAGEVIVVADYTKFGKRAFTQIAPIEAITKVITNVQVDNEYKKFFFENNIKIFTTIDNIC